MPTLAIKGRHAIGFAIVAAVFLKNEPKAVLVTDLADVPSRQGATHGLDKQIYSATASAVIASLPSLVAAQSDKPAS